MDISSESMIELSVDSLQIGGGGTFSKSMSASVAVRGADETLETDCATSSYPCIPITRPSLIGDDGLSLMQRWSIISPLISGRSPFEICAMLANCLLVSKAWNRKRII